MIVIDASVAIGFLAADDLWHEPAIRFLVSNLRHECAIHPVTLAEVLAGGAAGGEEVQMLAVLRDAGIEAMQPDDGEALRLARLRVASGLKMPDCCVVSAARQLGAPIATFDARLARAARAIGVVLAVDPA